MPLSGRSVDVERGDDPQVVPVACKKFFLGNELSAWPGRIGCTFVGEEIIRPYEEGQPWGPAEKDSRDRYSRISENRGSISFRNSQRLDASRSGAKLKSGGTTARTQRA